MATLSETDSQEKDTYHVQTSGPDDSNHSTLQEKYDEKSAVPVRVQDPNALDDASSDSIKEVFDVQSIDPVLARKMTLVNKAIDEIGMTNFQWKMFFLNGFGYAVDSVSLI